MMLPLNSIADYENRYYLAPYEIVRGILEELVEATDSSIIARMRLGSRMMDIVVPREIVPDVPLVGHDVAITRLGEEHFFHDFGAV